MENPQREKERDRSRRGDRPSRFSDAPRDRSNDRNERSESRRLFVSNIPYEFRWTELKDLFKDKVGNVAYVELFTDENGKPRGCGVVEFTTAEAMKKAMFVMHRYELNGRKLVLKEENGGDSFAGNEGRPRPPAGRSGGGGGGGGNRGPRDEKDSFFSKPREPENFNTYGLSLQFLESINIQPPLVKKVFVANLDYKADRTKIKEVFKMAGKVRNIDLAIDKDGNSRGFAVIEYDHPVEAVQAISMFDKQTLFERRMTVRMDRGNDKTELRLPDGLKGIGLGLGPNGEPLRDVARNLPQTPGNNMNLQGAGSTLNTTSVLGALPTPNVNVLNGLGAGLTANTLSATNALGGGLGLQALGLTGLGALQNQLLQQGLTANDLATMLTAQAQVQAANQANQASLNLANNELLATNNVLANNLGSNMNNLNSLSSSLGNNGALSSGPMSGNYGSNRQMNSMSSMSSQQQNYARESSAPPVSRDKPSDMVVITNLPPTVTWQLIREKFGECGDVKFAEMTAPDTAIVRFHKEWDAERAIKMFDRTRIDGRTIDVRFF